MLKRVEKKASFYFDVPNELFYRSSGTEDKYYAK